jgi:hypothetical protein
MKGLKRRKLAIFPVLVVSKGQKRGTLGDFL